MASASYLINCIGRNLYDLTFRVTNLIFSNTLNTSSTLQIPHLQHGILTWKKLMQSVTITSVLATYATNGTLVMVIVNHPVFDFYSLWYEVPPQSVVCFFFLKQFCHSTVVFVSCIYCILIGVDLLFISSHRTLQCLFVHEVRTPLTNQMRLSPIDLWFPEYITELCVPYSRGLRNHESMIPPLFTLHRKTRRTVINDCPV